MHEDTCDFYDLYRRLILYYITPHRHIYSMNISVLVIKFISKLDIVPFGVCHW